MAQCKICARDLNNNSRRGLCQGCYKKDRRDGSLGDATKTSKSQNEEVEVCGLNLQDVLSTQNVNLNLSGMASNEDGRLFSNPSFKGGMFADIVAKDILEEKSTNNDSEASVVVEKFFLTELILSLVRQEILPLQDRIKHLEEEKVKMQSLEREVKDLRTQLAAQTKLNSDINGKLAPIQSEVQDLHSKLDVKKNSSDVDEKLVPIQKILDNHQRFLDRDDAIKREANLIITGVPESDDDSAKVSSIFEVVQCTGVNIKKVVRLGKLGEDRGNRQRPLLVITGDVTDKKKILANKGKLKSAGEEYKHVYIKADQSLAVRKEWSRLREVKRQESKTPTNVGCQYRIDYKTGELLRDGVVIDKFQSPFRGRSLNQ